MLYLIFFLLRDGVYLTNIIIRAFPMGNQREKNLLLKVSEVIQSTIKGNFVVAALQGGLGGIMFWALGISAPLLWGVIMVFASLLPAIGAAIVWGPVALYLLLTGAYIKGIILVFVGAGVIGLVDNFLRPILVGRDTGLPDYMVLLTTLGGLSIVGLNGFVVGPLIAALFVSVWGIFMRDINSESEEVVDKSTNHD
jgi:predicted PurR-regulated permease PerM